ncbi:hypothetical protein Tco_0556439 [Tanacetum coccineum]
MSATTEALIAVVASTHHPSELPSPPLLLQSASHRDDIPEADMPLRKKARFTTPTSRSKVGESSAAVAARQLRLDVATVDATPGRPMSREVGYRIEDVWDDMVEDMEERAPTIVKGLSQRVRDLSLLLLGILMRYMFDSRKPMMTELFRGPESTHCLEIGDIIFTQLCFWRARLGMPGKHGDMPWIVMT